MANDQWCGQMMTCVSSVCGGWCYLVVGWIGQRINRVSEPLWYIDFLWHKCFVGFCVSECSGLLLASKLCHLAESGGELRYGPEPDAAVLHKSVTMDGWWWLLYSAHCPWWGEIVLCLVGLECVGGCYWVCWIKINPNRDWANTRYPCTCLSMVELSVNQHWYLKNFCYLLVSWLWVGGRVVVILLY